MDTQELVRATPLTESDRRLGEAVADLIAKNQRLGVQSIFWWFDDEAGTWKLTVACSSYREQGPRFTYATIRSVLKANNFLERLPLDTIWAIEDKHPIVTAVFSVVRPAVGVHFENCILNRLPVAGMHFLYVAPRKPKRKPEVHKKAAQSKPNTRRPEST